MESPYLSVSETRLLIYLVTDPSFHSWGKDLTKKIGVVIMEVADRTVLYCLGIGSHGYEGRNIP